MLFTRETETDRERAQRLDGILCTSIRQEMWARKKYSRVVNSSTKYLLFIWIQSDPECGERERAKDRRQSRKLSIILFVFDCVGSQVPRKHTHTHSKRKKKKPEKGSGVFRLSTFSFIPSLVNVFASATRNDERSRTRTRREKRSQWLIVLLCFGHGQSTTTLFIQTEEPNYRQVRQFILFNSNAHKKLTLNKPSHIHFSNFILFIFIRSRMRYYIEPHH